MPVGNVELNPVGILIWTYTTDKEGLYSDFIIIVM